MNDSDNSSSFNLNVSDSDLISINTTTKTTSNILCEICAKQLNHLTPLQRQRHVNNCLNKKEDESKFEKEKHNWEDTIDCPLCKKPISGGPFRASHLKSCGKAYHVSANAVIQLLDTQQKVSDVRRKQGLSHTSVTDEDIDVAKALSLSLNQQDALPSSSSSVDSSSAPSVKRSNKVTKDFGFLISQSCIHKESVEVLQHLQEKLFSSNLLATNTQIFSSFSLKRSDLTVKELENKQRDGSDNNSAEEILCSNSQEEAAGIQIVDLVNSDSDENDVNVEQNVVTGQSCISLTDSDLLALSIPLPEDMPDVVDIEDNSLLPTVSSTTEPHEGEDAYFNDTLDIPMPDFHAEDSSVFEKSKEVPTVQSDDKLFSNFVKIATDSKNELLKRSEIELCVDTEITLRERLEKQKNFDSLQNQTSTILSKPTSKITCEGDRFDRKHVSPDPLLTQIRPVVSITTAKSSKEKAGVTDMPPPSTPLFAGGIRSGIRILKTTNITPQPEFQLMSSPQLKEELGKNGVRKLSRKRAVPLLQKIYDMQHPIVSPGGRIRGDESGSTSEEGEGSDTNQHSLEIVEESFMEDGDDQDIVLPTSTEDEKLLIDEIRKRQQLHFRVLTYQLVSFEEIYELALNTGLRWSRARVIDFLDSQNITWQFQSKPQRTHRGHKKRKAK